jgi:DNA-binding LytR/AlgR family response regulator
METARGASVQPARDGRLSWRDRWFGFGPSGAPDRTNGVICVGIALIVVADCLVNAVSVNSDLERFGRAHWFWEPFVWQGSSAVLVIALLALPRRAGRLAAVVMDRPVKACLLFLALLLVFSGAHVAGMVALRKFAYAASGAAYFFNWSVDEILYEFRKDVFSFSTLAIMFWLAERAFKRRDSAVAAHAGESDAKSGAVPDNPTCSSEIWLRDGRSSKLIDARDVAWVGSAGNYVEYTMVSGTRHLVRGTLQQEEARLSTLGIARVHRTRLINLKKVVAINWGKSGDFELRLETGESIAGSRRYRGSVAGISGS